MGEDPDVKISLRRSRGIVLAIALPALPVLPVLIGACIVTGLPEIQADDVERARIVFPETTRVRLEAGRRTFSQRCGACHQAYDPRDRSEPEWREALGAMSERAGLDGERRAQVLEYLLAFASKPR